MLLDTTNSGPKLSYLRLIEKGSHILLIIAQFQGLLLVKKTGN